MGAKICSELTGRDTRAVEAPRVNPYVNPYVNPSFNHFNQFLSALAWTGLSYVILVL